MKPSLFFDCFLRSFLHLLVFSLIFNSVFFSYSVSAALASDLPIVVDGSTNTQVLKTASGVDQVNIAAPNSSGVSHNKFIDYNVNRSGQVVNNFSGTRSSEIAAGSGLNSVTSTSIGGLVMANPNLYNAGGRAASLIINEVTSTNNSQLLGYTEIAGSKANLIIANPNGIFCNSCGFINTSRLSLIAGSSNSTVPGSFNLSSGVRDPNNSNLTIPLITIEGLGLDAETVSHTDIISSATKLIAAIYAGDSDGEVLGQKAIVNLKSGDQYNYNTGEVSSTDSPPPDSSLPELFAIDASNLGAIQSGRIFIVATKAGFGVNMGGNLIVHDDLNIDARGNVYYKNVAATNGSVDIRSRGVNSNITQRANSLVIAKNNFTVNAEGNFTNQNNALIKTLNDSSSNLNITAKNFNNYGSVIAANNLNIVTAQNLNNYAILNAKNLIYINSGDILNDTNAIIGAFSYRDEAGVLQIFNNKNIEIHGKNLNNKNIISSNSVVGSLSINLSGSLTNFASGSISSNGIVNIDAINLKNSGLIYSDDNINLTANNLLENSHIIYSKKILNLNKDLNLTLNAANIENKTNGKLFADQKINLFANNLTNDDSIFANAIDINTSGNITNNNNGNIIAGNLLDITTNNITNNGNVISNLGNLKIKSNSLTNRSLIQANQALTIDAQIIDNQDTKLLAAQLLLTPRPPLKGLISELSSITITANEINNSNGFIQSSGLLKAAITNNQIVRGVVTSSSIVTTSAANTLGSFVSASAIDLDLGALSYNITGELASDDITITAASISNSGVLNATNKIELTSTVGNITNGNSAATNNKDIKLLSSNNLIINAANKFINYAIVSSSNNLTITATNSDINNYGSITGGVGTLTINATNGSLNNYQNNPSNLTTLPASKITANNNLIINAANLNNYANISANNNLTANITNNLSNGYASDAESPYAFFWAFLGAGNNLNLNINNNFVNERGSAIIAVKNIIIKSSILGSDSLYKMNNFTNNSALLESLEGSIFINTKNFTNKRDALDLTVVDLIRTEANKVWYDAKIIAFDNTPYRADVSNNWGWVDIDFSKPTNPYKENYYYSVFDGHSSGLGITKTTRVRRVEEAGHKISQIKSAENITITSDSFNNNSASITSLGNITINTNSFSNKSQGIYYTIDHRCSLNNGGTCYRYKVNENRTLTYIDARGSGGVFSFESISDFIPSSIKARNDLNIYATVRVSNGAESGDEVSHDSTLGSSGNSFSASGAAIGATSTTASPTKSDFIQDSAYIDSAARQTLEQNHSVDVSDSIASIDNGAFQINDNPLSPLFETRAQFIDQSKYYGSDYFFAMIGYTPLGSFSKRVGKFIYYTKNIKIIILFPTKIIINHELKKTIF